MKTITKITDNKDLAMTATARRKNKGLVIIAVLWMVVVLMVLSAILGRKSRIDAKVCMARMEAVRCKWACRAGIERAMAVMNEDETENDSLLDVWSNNPEDLNDVMLEQCVFSVRVIDESSKLDINTATKEQLLGLPDMVEEIADAIIDWRDSDDVPSGAGAESGYYESLTYGYMARNGPFRTLRELLLVKDVTEELFYGEDTNLNGRLDYNERDGQISPPADDGDDILDVGWAAYLTCYTSGGSVNDSNESSEGQSQSSGNQQQQSSNQQQSSGNNGRSSGNNQQSTANNQQSSGNNSQNSESTNQGTAKININTASDIVLAALLGGGDEAERIAQSIIAYRNTLTDGIEDVSELTEKGVLNENIFGQLEQYITTSSSIFTIRCFAAADRNNLSGTTLMTEAVVDRSSKPFKILFWYQQINN